MADPVKWIIGDYQEDDPVLTGRIAYYCQCKGLPVHYNGNSYRSSAQQLIYYNEYLHYIKTKIPNADGVVLAAKPGSSAHEYREAADIKSGHPLYTATNAELKAYGLCKPLWNKGEHWHVQVIELNTTSSAMFKKNVPVDLALLLKIKYTKLSDNDITYIANYGYAKILASGLIYGNKNFSNSTIKYIKGLSGLDKKLNIT
jgi:hypothetical protein